MDEMIFKLRSGFLRSVIAKVVSGVICRKFGCKVDVLLDKLEFESIDGDTTVSAGVSLKMSSSEFKKLVTSFAKNTDSIMKEG